MMSTTKTPSSTSTSTSTTRACSPIRTPAEYWDSVTGPAFFAASLDALLAEAAAWKRPDPSHLAKPLTLLSQGMYITLLHAAQHAAITIRWTRAVGHNLYCRQLEWSALEPAGDGPYKETVVPAAWIGRSVLCGGL